MSRYVSLCPESDITELNDEVVVLSPKSRNYVGFRGAARDVLLILQNRSVPVCAAELARFAVPGASLASHPVLLQDAEYAIDACFQLFIDEGIVTEPRR